MNSVNRVTLMGHIGADLTWRGPQNGKPFINMWLVTDDYWKDSVTREIKEKPAWHRIIVMGAAAEICNKYVKKGDKIYIEGSLSYSSYEKDGHTFYTPIIVLTNMNLLDYVIEGNLDIGIPYLPEDGMLHTEIPLQV